mmetsp:Transcript_23503/g.39381  ORF Transcript_23503/g.39381 Transcript_23503/m.39381 type:complete len:224 (+) Transcript_23503:510-1181(+)
MSHLEHLTEDDLRVCPPLHRSQGLHHHLQVGAGGRRRIEHQLCEGRQQDPKCAAERFLKLVRKYRAMLFHCRTELEGVEVVLLKGDFERLLGALLAHLLVQVGEVDAKGHAAEDHARHVRIIGGSFKRLVALLGRRASLPLGLGHPLLRVVPPPHQLVLKLLAARLRRRPPQLLAFPRHIHRQTKVRPPGGVCFVGFVVRDEHIVWLDVAHAHPARRNMHEAL